jgi:hypothetical protein
LFDEKAALAYRSGFAVASLCERRKCATVIDRRYRLFLLRLFGGFLFECSLGGGESSHGDAER